MGWDWGQAIETKNYPLKRDTGSYTFAFGNITDRNHTESKMATLELWKNKKIIESFEGSEIQIRRYGMMELPTLLDFPFPLVTILSARSGDNSMHIVFTTKKFTPIPIPLERGGYRIIWELVGSYAVTGYIDGETFSYTTEGYLEYVA